MQTTSSCRSIHVALAALFMCGATLAASAQEKVAKAPTVVSLKEAPVNTWARIAWSPTGGREQPVFVYAPNLNRFVMASGIQATGGMVPRHYDTEEFDLPSATWRNAYPPALAGNRPQSGPVGEDYAKLCMMIGHSGGDGMYKDGDMHRLGAGGQWLETRLGYHWCYVPDNGKIYVSYKNKTLAYDTAKRTWEDLATKPRTSGKVWGAMCYDPVNKEIVHAGGDGASDEVGTWVFSIATNEWRKLEFGSPAMKPLQAEAAQLLWRTKSLIGAAANRFTISETPEEAKVDLRDQGKALVKAAQQLVVRIESADLQGTEKLAAGVAVRRLEAAAVALAALDTKLQTIAPATLMEARAARERIEQTIDALASEPPGRARSQIAYAPEHKKIVMFGGDRLEKTVADTWLYDNATRTWEQKFPATCPLPRAGHVLAWLPQAKQIVLAGGYSRDWLPQEVWTYDIAKNQWSLLLHEPLQSEDSGRAKASPNAPRVHARGNQVGAVAPDDTLVCVDGTNRNLSTWACKVDPSRPLKAPAPVGIGASGQYTWNKIDPADWEAVAKPDAERMKAVYAELPANQWTALSFAKYAPGATNRWGTSAYDTKRSQILLWGGGHSTSHENDVAHFSLRGGCWTIGFHPDDPIEIVYASQPTPVSFADRPHVPIHAYRAYCFDPTAEKMLFFDLAYDLNAREWEPKVSPGLEHRGPMHSHMTATPHGAVTFSEKGLFRFDVKNATWRKLPWDGPKPAGIWCDGDGLCYDAKRDALWLSVGPDIYRYSFATNKGEKVPVRVPAGLGKYVFYGETAYLPDDDLILLMRRVRRPDGQWANLVFDPAAAKFHWMNAKIVGPDGKEMAFKETPFGWDDALAYDPHLKLVVLNSSHLRNVFVLRFDRKRAGLEEVSE